MAGVRVVTTAVRVHRCHRLVVSQGLATDLSCPVDALMGRVGVSLLGQPGRVVYVVGGLSEVLSGSYISLVEEWTRVDNFVVCSGLICRLDREACLVLTKSRILGFKCIVERHSVLLSMVV